MSATTKEQTGNKKAPTPGGKKAANFVIQGSILAIAGIVVRLIGMLYRIPLINIIGKKGNGYYTSSYGVYNILLILSSYSMPVAVSKMVATRIAREEHQNSRRILRAALVYATVIGGVAAAVLWFGAETFAQLIKTPFSMYALKTLAPTIWIMAYLGVLRGYFQGTGSMVPTAISQILEQIVNAIVSVGAAALLFRIGTSMNQATGATEYSYALGAAGGTIGTGAGALTALIFFMFLTMSRAPERRRLAEADVSGRRESYRQLAHTLTLGSSEAAIATLWGILGQYQLLFNIPVAVSNALSSSLIPSLSRAVASGNREQTLERIDAAVRFSMVIAIPAAYAFSCLNFYCKKQMYYLVLVSQMFAPVIVIIPLYTMMNKMGLIDSWLSLVLMNTTFNLAFIVLMLKATFDGVPKEVVEAAKIDGCSPFMVMTRIFLPVSSTGIAVAVIFAFTRTWNEFLFAFTFISTTEKKPIIVSLYEILKNNPAVGIPWHYVMAGAMYTTVPLVILFICIRNYITGDHTAGAIK